MPSTAKGLFMISKIITTLAVVLIGYMFYKNNSMPSYLGVDDGQLSRMPSTPNAVSSQTKIPEKQVQPIAFDDLATAKARALAALKTLGRNEVVTDNGDYVHAVFTTPLMRFHDDVELYFDADNGVMHYRSQSRTGYSDAGVNRARYNEFVKAFQQANG